MGGNAIKITVYPDLVRTSNLLGTSTPKSSEGNARPGGTGGGPHRSRPPAESSRGGSGSERPHCAPSAPATPEPPPRLRTAVPATLTASQSPGESEGEGCAVQEKSPIHFPFRERGKDKNVKKKKNALHAQLFLGLKSSGRSREQKARSVWAVLGAERGWPPALSLSSPASWRSALAPSAFPHTCSRFGRRCPGHSQRD